MNRSELWNAAELAENRKNSTVAREWEIALPDELTPEQRENAAHTFARELVKRFGVAADICIHAPNPKGDQRNFHAHILTTTRKMTPSGLTTKTRELDDKKTGAVEQMRYVWEEIANSELERAGQSVRISAAKLDENRQPTIHIGVAATALERRGIATERGEENRRIKLSNQTIKEEVLKVEAELENIEHQIEREEIQQEIAEGRQAARQWYEAEKQKSEAKKSQTVNRSREGWSR